MKTKSVFQTLDDEDLSNITGGMYQAAKWATRGTRMGDSTVEGQPWYKAQRAANTQARTAEFLSNLKTSNPGGYNQLMHPAPFKQASSVPLFTYKPNPYPDHPEFRPRK